MKGMYLFLVTAQLWGRNGGWRVGVEVGGEVGGGDSCRAKTSSAPLMVCRAGSKSTSIPCG